MKTAITHNTTTLDIQPAPAITPPKQDEKITILALDGLRAFAALGVVTLHIIHLVGKVIIDEHRYPWLAFYWVFGNAGVQLFFVLSGFLLFMPYAKALLFREKWPSTRKFYLRRTLRILPGYYFSLFILIIFVQRQYLHPNHWSQLLLFLTFFMDASKATFQQINVPYWSLAIEVQFYLLLPLIALAIRLFVRRVAQHPRTRLIAAIGACIAIIISGLTIRYYGLQFTHQPSPDASQFTATIFFFIFGVWGKYWEDFAVGMIVCLCFVYTQHSIYGHRLQHQLKQASTYLAIAAVALLTFCAIWNFRTSYPVQTFDLWLPLVPYRLWLLDICTSIGWGLLILILLFGKRHFRILFEWKPVRWVGTISYSIYLWHLPMLTIFKKYVFSHLYVTNSLLSHFLFGVWFWLAIIPWCILVYWFIERPFIHFKERRMTISHDTC